MTTAERQGVSGGSPKKRVPSYMQPTKSSRMKENLYGTEFKYVPKKLGTKPEPPPAHHGLDYIPQRPASPGCPRFMQQTRTSKGKISDVARQGPVPRSVTKQNMQKTPDFDVYASIRKPFRPVNSTALQANNQCKEYSPKEAGCAYCAAFRDEIAKEQRRTASCVTQNSIVFGCFEEPPNLYRKSTGMEACKSSLIQTAPEADLHYEDSSESFLSTGGPSTPSLRTPRRPRSVPRYMMPTSSSAARVRQ